MLIVLVNFSIKELVLKGGVQEMQNVQTVLRLIINLIQQLVQKVLDLEKTAKEDSSFLRMDIQNLQQEFCLKKLPAIDYQSLDQN